MLLGLLSIFAARTKNSTVNKIERKVDDLIGTLSNVSDDDSKIKSYVEQKKVIGDIKSIIKEFSK